LNRSGDGQDGVLGEISGAAAMGDDHWSIGAHRRHSGRRRLSGACRDPEQYRNHSYCSHGFLPLEPPAQIPG
jgi:hypothetical protein